MMSSPTPNKEKAAVVTTNQKFSLQKRDDQGSFKKVATLGQSITTDEVLKKYGAGYYVLRSTKPRFKTIWKGQLGNDPNKELQSLEKKTKYLTYGFAGVATTEAIGFGFSAWKFIATDERLDKIEAVLRLFKPGYNCVACGKPLDSFLQKFCGQCGVRINWPRRYYNRADTLPCFSCKSPIQLHQSFCPNCGQCRPIQIDYQFQPVNSIQGSVPVSRECV